MKFIKTYEGYSLDEYISAVKNSLKDYNLNPIQITQIISSYEDDIMKAHNDGMFPTQFVNDIANRMDIGQSGYPVIGLPKGKNITLKYL